MFYSKKKVAVLFGIDVKEIVGKDLSPVTGFLGTIVIGEKTVTKLSKNALKVGIMHERYHQRFNRSFHGIICNIMGVIFLILGILGIIGTILSVFLMPQSSSYTEVIAFLLFLGMTLLTIYSRRFGEVSADLYSAKEVGKENFVMGFKEIMEYFPPKHPRLRLLSPAYWFYLVTHPSVESRIKFIEES